jgi:hypothetical protein
MLVGPTTKFRPGKTGIHLQLIARPLKRVAAQ